MKLRFYLLVISIIQSSINPKRDGNILNDRLDKELVQNLEGFGADMDLVISKSIVVSNEETLRAALSSQEDSWKTEIKMVSKEYSLSTSVSLVNLNNILIRGPCTFTNHGIVIKNCRNIILDNIRIFNTSLDGILVSNSSNVVINSVTVLDSSRTDIVRGKDIDVT